MSRRLTANKRYIDAKLTPQEIVKVRVRIEETRSELGYVVGDPITYDLIRRAHNWIYDRFRYTSDDSKKTFEKPDFWNTLAFEWLMLDDVLYDDCDGMGYALIEFFVRVLGYETHLKDICRVSCQAETGEGHFVCWLKASDEIWYQVENRFDRPYTIRKMKEIGYEYWHYSSMEPKYIKKDKWFNARQKAMNIIYDTPAMIEADEPEFTIDKATSISKSKTLLKEWFGVVSGSVITVSSIVKDYGNEVVNTLQANQGNLSQFLEPQYVGSLMVFLSIIGIYLRTITNKDISMKVDYDK